ncbi:unnamed protein product [Prorocentrum cordatum]|uniref:Uncharacterized protein n=1 Tax=Prorocentrum cordatum TaxID=2364126 RepID=A0ABN9XY39_9DINO|nr:unnamed protein product [Polarella glacialis]
MPFSVRASPPSEVDRAGPDGHTFREALREGNEQVALRAARLLDVVRTQAGKAVAVVTHKGFLRELNRGPLRDFLDKDSGQLPILFGNAEVRVCEVAWDEHGHLEEVVARTLEEVADAPPMEMWHKSSWRGDGTSSWTGGLARLISGGSFDVVEDLAEVAGGGLRAGAGTSAEESSGPAEAAATAWRAMEERLGGPPSVALVFCDQAMEGAEVARGLRPLAGAAFVVGGSSCGGVLSARGPHEVGVLGLRNFAHRCSVGSVEDVTDGGARRHAARAVAEAAGGLAPHLVLVCSCPGSEEDQKGRITQAHGRFIVEINGLPAAAVLNEWAGGALQNKVAGGCVMRERFFGFFSGC